MRSSRQKNNPKDITDGAESLVEPVNLITVIVENVKIHGETKAQVKADEKTAKTKSILSSQIIKAKTKKIEKEKEDKLNAKIAIQKAKKAKLNNS